MCGIEGVWREGGERATDPVDVVKRVEYDVHWRFGDAVRVADLCLCVRMCVCILLLPTECFVCTCTHTHTHTHTRKPHTHTHIHIHTSRTEPKGEV